jgi:hypothetical protein
MSVQTLSTPSGDKLVVLPIDEYEDLVDGRAFDASIQAIRSGDMDMLTQAEADAYLAAPSPLAFWRAYRGLSLASLAGAADVPQTELVRLEAGATDGDVRVFARLAAALRVRIDDLVIA